MENLLTTLGTLFFMFLVLAAATEVILEMFRGLAERIGIPWVKSQVTLEEALKLSAEFAKDNSTLNTKLEAVQAVANQLKSTAAQTTATLTSIKENLTALAPADSKDAIAGEITQVANRVKAQLDANERVKVWILRSAAAVIGCVLVSQSEFYVFKILSQSKEANEYLGLLTKLQGEWINIFVGGFAAAAGSSYWHDQLDRIRSLKSAIADAKKLNA